jgi:hypothetical protein
MSGFHRTAASQQLRRVPPEYSCARTYPDLILTDILLRIHPDRRSAVVLDSMQRESCACMHVPGRHRLAGDDTYFPERHPALLHLKGR